MIKAITINEKGEKSDISLKDEIFNIKVSHDLIKQSIVAQNSNARHGNAHSKTRAEVSGGGKKPWKQKGTGNARAGSSRSPLWKGGGITFGPRNDRNWEKRISKKMLRKSIIMSLTEKAKDKKIIVLDKLNFKSIKTKIAYEVFSKLPVREGSFLLVLPKSDMNIELSMRNLPFVKVINVSSINILDVTKKDWLIFTKDSLDILQKLYLKSESVVPLTKKNNAEEKKESPIIKNKRVNKKAAK